MRFDEDDEHQEPFYKKPGARPRQEPDREPELFLRPSEKRAEDNAWDAPKGRERGQMLYDPLPEEAQVREPEPVAPPPAAAPRPGGRVALFLLAGVCLAVILGLIGLYSVTSEFRLASPGSSEETVVEEPPAGQIDEGTPEDLTPVEPVVVEEGEPAGEDAGPDLQTLTPKEPTLVEEVTGGDPEPPPPVRAEPPRAALPAPPSQKEEPTKEASSAPSPRPAAPVTREEPDTKPDTKAARSIPAYRPPVIREGGVRPGPGVSPPIPLEIPKFRYPEAARGQSLGDVIVRVDLLVDERGRVLEVVVSEGEDSGLGFNETALAAARRVKFQPATRGDTPVKMWTEMMFEFSEPGR
jgi:TonB family protein